MHCLHRIILLVLCAVTGVLLGEEKPMEFQHCLMPVPVEISPRPGMFRLTSGFAVSAEGAVGSMTTIAANRLIRRLADRTGLFFEAGFLRRGDSPAVFRIVSGAPGETRLGSDESYTLEITPDQITLSAATELGVIHGIETFLQLFEADAGGYYFPAVTIHDRPRFPWRGLMLDVCRHFQPLEVVKRNIDAMAAVKLNVLHLHLSEDQGFRIESKVFPRLHELGSDGEYFTQEQIREIIRYARERGIRVYPEFDMPSHSTAWFVGYPHLASIDSTYTIERGWGIKDPAMNPILESTYEFLDAFISEMAALFPDEYFHIGGDENNGKQWNRNPDIQAFKAEHGFKTNHELQSYFIERVRAIVARHGKKMVGWNEIYDPGMSKDIISHYWNDHGMREIQGALELGFKAIVSNGYYIDLFWDTERHYLNDPFREEFITDPALEKNILGGEVPNWSEFVVPEVIDARIWPRTAAIAERFWSPREVRDVEDMYRRLERVSFRMEELGLNHIRNQDMMLRRLANNQDISALKVLIGVVEPLEGYQRHFAVKDRKYKSFSPLTRIVDIAPADALPARKFRKQVENYLVEYAHVADAGRRAGWWQRKTGIRELARSPLRQKLAATLAEWQRNHARLQALVDGAPILEEIRSLSLDLQRVAAAGLEALEYLDRGKTAPRTWYDEKTALLKQAEPARGEVELRIISALQSLVDAAGGVTRE